jgi:hypothetical protein
MQCMTPAALYLEKVGEWDGRDGADPRVVARCGNTQVGQTQLTDHVAFQTCASMIIISEPSAESARSDRTSRCTPIRSRSSSAHNNTHRHADTRPISVHTTGRRLAHRRRAWEGGSVRRLAPGGEPVRRSALGANLSRAQLRRADLSGADLVKADLSDAELRDADLSGAQLRLADLSDAPLKEANVSGAQLWGANLSRAGLWGGEP